MFLKVDIFVTLKVKNRRLRFLKFSVTMIVIDKLRNLPFLTFNVKFNLKFPYK